MYRRKTVPKFHYDFVKILLVTLLLSMIPNLIKRAVAVEFVSPISDVELVEIEVEKTVEVVAIPEGVQEIIESVFQDKANEAKRVVKCESGFNPRALNGSTTASGLFQIMASLHGVSRKNLQDPLINTLIAKKLYDAQGWVPWLASNGCHGLLK